MTKGYNCRDCGIFHLDGQHTPAGQAKIQARYADPAYKNRARQLKCFGCGSNDHLLAACPDPHKLQVAAKAAETHAAETLAADSQPVQRRHVHKQNESHSLQNECHSLSIVPFARGKRKRDDDAESAAQLKAVTDFMCEHHY